MGARLKFFGRQITRKLPWRKPPESPAAPNSELWSKVRDILVERLKIPAADVTPQARFVEDLGLDSLDSVELLMTLEETFGFEIPDTEAD